MSTAPSSASQRLGVLPFGDLSVVLPDPHCVRYLNLNNPLNTKRKFCNVLKWKEENINCCSKGKYVGHPLLPIPPDIEDIFSAPSFLKRQPSYNGTFAMIALGASPWPTWAQSSYPSMLKLHGKPYHRVMDSFRETYGGTVANNQARMYIYDNEIKTDAKRLQLDADTLTYLSNRIKQDNKWVKQYHTLLLEIDQSEHHNLCISFEETARVTPTARTEIAALLYKDDEHTPAQRHVYTFSRSGPTDEYQKPRFVPIWSVLYESFSFPFIFLFGEPGWSQ